MSTEVKVLVDRLQGVRSRIRSVLIADALLRFVAVTGALAAGSYVLDRVFRLPIEARVAMLAIMVAVMFWGARRFFLKPFAVRIAEDDLALLVESRHPEYESLLISALQLSRDLEAGRTTESPELIRSVVADAVERFRGADFKASVSSRHLTRPATAALMAALVVGGFTAAFPDQASLWFSRCILLSPTPWPPRTRLEVKIANIEKFATSTAADGAVEILAPEGSTIRVDVTAEGDVPNSVQIRKTSHPRADGQSPIVIDVPARDSGDLFEYKFGRVSQSFEFWVTGGDDDDETPYYRIVVRNSPRIESFEADYDLPQYVNDTGEPDKAGVREYNLLAPVGTEVTMRFGVSAELERFDLVFDDKPDQPIRLTPEAAKANVYVHRFTLETDRFYTYRLIGKNGAPSREAPNFAVTAQPDQPPQIGIQLPEAATIDVTPTATALFLLQITDDFRIGRVDLRWDAARDGAYTNLLPFGETDLRVRTDGREATAFRALELRDLAIVRDGAAGPVRPGDTIYVRFDAFDTRATAKEPNPNRFAYPSPVALHVREGVEIERELVRSQVRLKEQTRRALETTTKLIVDIDASRRETDRKKTDADRYRNELFGMLSAQDLTVSGLQETARGYVRVFDGYLFNRLDPTPLTEAMVADLIGLHRREDARHDELVARALATARLQIDDGEAMGKVARIMDLLFGVSRNAAPEASRALKTACETSTVEETKTALDQSHAAMVRLEADLTTLVEKMEEWEDFQDMVQSLKDIIDLERGLTDRMKRIAK